MKLMPSQEKIMPGTIVLAFDNRHYKDDLTTPMSKTHKVGIVKARYGIVGKTTAIAKASPGIDPSVYNEPDCVDVEFIEDEYLAKSKFTHGVINLQIPYGNFVAEAREHYTLEFISMARKYFIFC